MAISLDIDASSKQNKLACIVVDDPQFGTTFDDVQFQSALDYANANGLFSIVANGNYTFKVNVKPYLAQKIEINGRVDMQEPQLSLLTADAGEITALTMTVAGATRNRSDNRVVPVADGTKFLVGQQVCITDNWFPYQGGGTWHTNQQALYCVITTINGNNITVDRDFSNWKAKGAYGGSLTTVPIGGFMFEVAKGARMISCESAFVLDGIDEVKIYGSGVVDGNRTADSGTANLANTIHINPQNETLAEEDFTSNCIISCIGESENFEVNGLELKSSPMHNIRLRSAISPKVINCHIHDSHDKNVLVHGEGTKHSFNGNIDNCLIENSLFEDGIILYSFADNFKITNNTIRRNARMGYAIQATCVGTQSIGNTIEFNENNCYWAAETGMTSTNDTIIGGRLGAYKTTNKFVLAQSLIIESRNCIIDGLRMYQPTTMSTSFYPESADWTPIVIRDIKRNASNPNGMANDYDQPKGLVFSNCRFFNLWCDVRNLTTMAWTGSPQNSTTPFIKWGGNSGGLDQSWSGATFDNCHWVGVGQDMLFDHTNGNGTPSKMLDFKYIYFDKCSWVDKTFTGTTTADLFGATANANDIANFNFSNCNII